MKSIRQITKQSLVLVVVFLVCVTGCGKTSVKMASVGGKVSRGANPMTLGIITFYPDASRGNSSKSLATGVIQPDGSYHVSTDGKEGAPMGWYKVTIRPNGMPAKMPAKGQPLPLAQSVNQKFTSPETTTLNVEVTRKSGSGQYDLIVE